MDYISELKKAEICEYGDQREEIICGMIIVWMTKCADEDKVKVSDP